MGTPQLAANCLKGLIEAGYDIPLVVTQPDRPKGRGRRLVLSPVKELALEHGLEIFQPERLRDPAAYEVLQNIAPDLIVVAAYGQILPKEVLELPPLGCINVHASLLPEYRGAAPIQWAILDGKKETGITIMLMEEGLDTGPMLLQKKIIIAEDMDFGRLYEALSQLGTQALLEAIPLWAKGELKPVSQQDALATYAQRLERQHEKIDWQKSSQQLHNQIRAFSPAPGAFALFNDREVKILAAEIADSEVNLGMETIPGRVLGIVRKKGPLVQTGNGALVLTRLQPTGRQPMDGASFVNGYRVTVGDCFS